MNEKFQVVVGNVGIVYSGNDVFTAKDEFSEYCKLSLNGVGKVAHEGVTLMEDGEPIAEIYGIFS